MVNQKVIIVPYWVRDSLWRGNHSIRDLLSFNTACKILSRDEIAILNKLQDPKYAEMIFGAPLGEYEFDLCIHWHETTHTSHKNDYDKLQKFIRDKHCEDEINARLFGEGLSITRDIEHVVTEVPGFGIAVTICPEFFTGANKAANSIAISREVAKLLYKYDCMSKIIQSPFGAKYIETLLQ